MGKNPYLDRIPTFGGLHDHILSALFKPRPKIKVLRYLKLLLTNLITTILFRKVFISTKHETVPTQKTFLYSLCFPCPTTNFPCAKLNDLGLFHMQNFLRNKLKISWQRSQYPSSLVLGNSQGNTKFLFSLCFSKLTVIYFIPFSLCSGKPCETKCYGNSLKHFCFSFIEILLKIFLKDYFTKSLELHTCPLRHHQDSVYLGCNLVRICHHRPV